MTSTTTPDDPSRAPYFLDNNCDQAFRSLTALAGTLDEFTFDQLSRLDIGAGQRWLELGPGLGSVSIWLADRVGPDGSVLALDLDPRHVPAHPHLTARPHDITAVPLPTAPVNGVFSRLVLAHARNRRDLIAQSRQNIGPGGWFVTNDWGRRSGLLLESPVPYAADTFGNYKQALRAVLDAAGSDGTFAERAVEELEAAGFVDVGQETWSRRWTGGSPGTDLVTAVSTEKAAALAQHGFGPDQLALLHKIMADPGTAITGNLTYSTIGRVPTA